VEASVRDLITFGVGCSEESGRKVTGSNAAVASPVREAAKATKEAKRSPATVNIYGRRVFCSPQRPAEATQCEYLQDGVHPGGGTRLQRLRQSTEAPARGILAQFREAR
jgi:hypothetical protein